MLLYFLEEEAAQPDRSFLLLSEGVLEDGEVRLEESQYLME